jgi:hypothetical protein
MRCARQGRRHIGGLGSSSSSRPASINGAGVSKRSRPLFLPLFTNVVERLSEKVLSGVSIAHLGGTLRQKQG